MRFSHFIWTLSLPLLFGCTPDDRPSASEISWQKAVEQAQSSRGRGLPALWHLSDEDTDIYLFGTVHYLPDNTVWTSDKILTAFDGSETVYFEINVTDRQTLYDYEDLEVEFGYLPDGESIYDLLSANEARQLRKTLRRIGYKETDLEPLMPWHAVLDISEHIMADAGYDLTKGVEFTLIKRAREQDKDFGHMETVAEQFAALSGGDIDEQIDSLKAMSDYDDSMRDDLDIMLSEWLDGDIQGLGILTATPGDDYPQAAYERMLVQRNKNWIPRIEAVLEKPGSHFIAVGAAHLAGADSVILMLEKRGHAVSQIQ